MTAPYKVICHGPDHDHGENHRRPVHRLGRQQRHGHRREKRNHKHERQVRHGDHVDGQRPTAQRKLGRRDGLARLPTPHVAADAHNVRHHERAGAKGHEAVEGDGAANVDERQEDRDEGGQEHGVDGDAKRGVHPREPPGVGQALVPPKGKHLPRGRRHDGDAGKGVHEEDNRGEEVGGGV